MAGPKRCNLSETREPCQTDSLTLYFVLIGCIQSCTVHCNYLQECATGQLASLGVIC